MGKVKIQNCQHVHSFPLFIIIFPLPTFLVFSAKSYLKFIFCFSSIPLKLPNLFNWLPKNLQENSINHSGIRKINFSGQWKDILKLYYNASFAIAVP